MTIYSIDTINKKTILAALILLKYTDKYSLNKLFSILQALYNFSPIIITTDFDMAQIIGLKECDNITKTPYIVTCLFNYGQAII